MHRHLLILLSFFSCLIYAIDQKYSYFDTKFLSQPAVVKQQLIEKEGFIEGSFPSSDGTALSYLWLKRPEARCTVICASGFWPGNKEGMATLYALLAKECNILFFDAQGHGESHGPFWSRLRHYGREEYNDVVAAVEWAFERSRQPIILYGICAGAFHALRALAHVERKRPVDIRGLIFDSGWNAARDVIPTALAGEWKTYIKRRLKSWPIFMQTGVIAPMSYLLRWTASGFAWLYLSKKAKQIDLQSLIQTIRTPIFYIHSEDDEYAPIGPVKQLAAQTPHAQTWWITEPSRHACHHLKHADAYAEHVANFIRSVVPDISKQFA